MSARRLTVVLLAIAAGAAGAGAGGLLETGDGEPSSGGDGAGGAVGRVVKVVDGDTIHVQVGATREKVRYIGVDTPETKHPTKGVQCYGQRASDFNASLVADEQVRLVRDVEERDRYGRLLAYVSLPDGRGGWERYNDELLRDGWARLLVIAPNGRYARAMLDEELAARSARRGLWAACSATDGG